MTFDPSSEPEINSLGYKRPSPGVILSVLIALAGIIVVVAILIAYGLVGTS